MYPRRLSPSPDSDEKPLAVLPALAGWRVMFAVEKSDKTLELRIEPMTHVAVLACAIDPVRGGGPFDFLNCPHVRASRADGTEYGMFATVVPTESGPDSECLAFFMRELKRQGRVKEVTRDRQDTDGDT